MSDLARSLPTGYTAFFINSYTRNDHSSKWNNQPPMVKKFIDKYSFNELIKLMPEKGNEYWKAVEKGENEGAEIVKSWSIGEHVIEPYKSELKAFWSSDGMREIQIETASTDMGQFALRKTIEGQTYYGLEMPLFSHFVYWFDQAVLNGTKQTQAFEKAESVHIEQVFEWMKLETGYVQESFNKNRVYWQELIKRVNKVQVKLWILAYLRSSHSREDFDTVTMCRRGSLALGSGWINGKLREFNFDDHVGLLDDQNSATTILKKLASSVNQTIPVLKLLEYKALFRPQSHPRYWGVVDFNQHSSKKRFYIFDVVDQTHTEYLVAHGKGSEGAKDDGFADIFSNVSGSNCSSLGIYVCAEAYDGTHGLSMKIDGMENTNSNARDRTVVIHGADYVSEDFIKKYGRIGRSEGCFVVEKNVTDELINKLTDGSLLIAWKE